MFIKISSRSNPQYRFNEHFLHSFSFFGGSTPSRKEPVTRLPITSKNPANRISGSLNNNSHLRSKDSSDMRQYANRAIKNIVKH